MSAIFRPSKNKPNANAKNFIVAENGIALMIVISSIALLTIIMYAFRYETSINVIKSINIEDKIQAKLNAQAGLNLAMARLEMYRDAYNTLQKNEEAKSALPPDILNQLWSLPISFPLPKAASTSMLARNVIENFEKNSFLQGGMTLTIDSLSNKINVNLMMTSRLKLLQLSKLPKNKNYSQDSGTDPNGQGGDTHHDSNDSSESSDKDATKSIQEEIANQLEELLKSAIAKKRDTDEFFFQKYAGKDLNYLVSAIRYYISDENADIGATSNQLEADFQKNNISAKHAPMNSVSEILLLPEWNDDLLDLIKNDITVYDTNILDLNHLSGNLLRLIAPNITDEQIAEFFKAKNDARNPLLFNSKDQFLDYLSNKIKVNDNSLKESVQKLEKLGIKLSATPNLFKVISVGTYGKSTFTLTAIVLLPLKIEQAEKNTIDATTPDTEEGNRKSKIIELLDNPSIQEITQS